MGALLLAAAALPGGVAAQEPDSVSAEMDRLRARMDSLEAVVRQLRGVEPGEEAAREPETQEDALARIRAAAREAAAAGGGGEEADTATTPGTFSGRQRSLQALNPEISVNVDVLGHLDTDDVNDRNFVPREFEFSFQSALDPFSRAKIFASVHAPGPELTPFGEAHGHGHAEGGEAEIGVEEGYVEWVGLPGGLGLKVGRFFQRFGALNRWHSHALPFQSRQLPHLVFIGEDPLAQTGVSATWLAPFHGFGTWDATVEVTRSSNELLFGESGRPSVLGHLNAFWELSTSTDLDLGLSWINGSWEDEEHLFDRNLYGVETAFTWRPPARSRYRELMVRGGVMLLDGLAPHADEDEEVAGEDDHEEIEPGTGEALGVWSMAEFRLDQQWLIGARLDWSENPADPDQTAWLFSPTLTWWQSEYVRLRAEYDLMGRSFLDDDEGRLWLQVTFAMGPHKHETY